MAIATETFDAQAVIDRACTSKHAFTNPADARRAAREATKRAGHPIRSYRCPFGDGCRRHAHFHIGHVSSLEGLEDIARAIRECHQTVDS